ncbi:MAG: response regulator, partial [Gammaproteobacteria bacterium]|nr:response regulator [Gammaproteobacteria bacterium]
MDNIETQQPTIFLVDDDVGIRRWLASALSERGFGMQAFESAQAFLDYYNAEEPGCLLLDVSLPGMTGLELQQELVKSAVSIPIIFITGQGDIPQSVRAIKAGAIDFLEKPFGIDALLERINRALAADSALRAQQKYRQALLARFDSLTEREQEV